MVCDGRWVVPELEKCETKGLRSHTDLNFAAQPHPRTLPSIASVRGRNLGRDMEVSSKVRRVGQWASWDKVFAADYGRKKGKKLRAYQQSWPNSSSRVVSHTAL